MTNFTDVTTTLRSMSAIVAVPTELLEEAEETGAIYRGAMANGLAWAFWLPDVSEIVRRRFQRAGYGAVQLSSMELDEIAAIPGIGPKTIVALERAGFMREIKGLL